MIDKQIPVLTWNGKRVHKRQYYIIKLKFTIPYILEKPLNWPKENFQVWVHCATWVIKDKCQLKFSLYIYILYIASLLWPS